MTHPTPYTPKYYELFEKTKSVEERTKIRPHGILKNIYQTILDSFGKTTVFPTKEDEEQILEFNKRMEKFDQEHKHELGEDPRLKYSTTLISQNI